MILAYISWYKTSWYDIGHDIGVPDVRKLSHPDSSVGTLGFKLVSCQQSSSFVSGSIVSNQTLIVYKICSVLKHNKVSFIK